MTPATEGRKSKPITLQKSVQPHAIIPRHSLSTSSAALSALPVQKKKKKKEVSTLTALANHNSLRSRDSWSLGFVSRIHKNPFTTWSCVARVMRAKKTSSSDWVTQGAFASVARAGRPTQAWPGQILRTLFNKGSHCPVVVAVERSWRHGPGRSGFDGLNTGLELSVRGNLCSMESTYFLYSGTRNSTHSEWLGCFPVDPWSSCRSCAPRTSILLLGRHQRVALVAPRAAQRDKH